MSINASTGRTVFVEGYGDIDIPNHISRVESSKWHGWQVRWPGHRRWFSDAAYGDNWLSLCAAVNYREQNYPGKRSQVEHERGVHPLVKFERNKAVIYAEATPPDRSRGPVRVYVGLFDSTATEERWRHAERKAHQHRDSMVIEHERRRGTVPQRGSIK